MKKVLNVILNVIRWIGVSFYLIMSIGSLSEGVLGILAAFLFLLGAVIIAPLGFIRKLRRKIKLNTVLSIILAVVLFFAGCMLLPTSEVPSNPNDDSQITGTLSNDTSGTSDITDNVTDTNSKDESASSSNDKTTSDNVQGTNNVTDNVSDTNVNSTSNKVPSSSSNNTTSDKDEVSGVGSGKHTPVNLSSIPTYSGNAYVVVNNNIPNFSVSELKTTGYETYSNLDSLGRTQMAIASVGKDTMPGANEERGSISSIKPTGWIQATYDNVSGKYLYNRCHLIGWQLSAENANKKNLITGTKYLNISGMLPFENMVADYIKETGNHVAYRITPIYQGNNLLASGVQMEAYSVEDNGAGICFNVYCYNVQPGITINYADGSSSGSSNSGGSSSTSTNTNTGSSSSTTTNTTSESYNYIANISSSSKKFHYPSCSSVKKMNENNKMYFTGTRDELINMGYDPCGNCHP